MKTPWSQVTLYFADGSGLRSSWDATHARALERGGPEGEDERTSVMITAEHRRALAELRDEGSCANWYTNAELEDDAEPRATDIDWTGFFLSEDDDA